MLPGKALQKPTMHHDGRGRAEPLAQQRMGHLAAAKRVKAHANRGVARVWGGALLKPPKGGLPVLPQNINPRVQTTIKPMGFI